MRKLLSGSLAFLAGMASVAAPGAIQPERKTPAADYRNDPRLSRLRSFFAKFQCPAGWYAGEFLATADSYSLDWRLLPSLSYVESTGGKYARNNNLFGWASGRAQFPSPAAAIREIGYRLTHSTLYRSKNIDQLLAIYNPSAAYARKVKAVMQQIAPSR
jgi:hypothetical protein